MPPASTKTKAETPATDQTPEQIIAALQQQLADTQAESAAKDTIIETQDVQLKSAAIQSAGALPVLSHEGKHYQVLAAVFGLKDGSKVKAEDLRTNTTLVKELIESGSGVLQLIEEKAEAKA